MRTISEPAGASAATWRTVASTSAVSVLVIDCTTIGAPPPTVTPPTSTATVLRRGCGPAIPVVLPSIMFMRAPDPLEGGYDGVRCQSDCPASTRSIDQKQSPRHQHHGDE